jgi:hypothetical protein
LPILEFLLFVFHFILLVLINLEISFSQILFPWILFPINRVKYYLAPSTNNHFFIKHHELTSIMFWPFKLPICCNLTTFIILDQYVGWKIKFDQNVTETPLFWPLKNQNYSLYLLISKKKKKSNKNNIFFFKKKKKNLGINTKSVSMVGLNYKYLVAI